jgi:hypothetical protein
MVEGVEDPRPELFIRIELVADSSQSWRNTSATLSTSSPWATVIRATA